MADLNEYDIGDLVQITGTFTNPSGIAADPSSVAAQVRTAGGSLIEPTTARVATGIYQVDVTADNQPGLWAYRFAGTGVLQAAGEGVFKVRRSEVI